MERSSHWIALDNLVEEASLQERDEMASDVTIEMKTKLSHHKRPD